jgi:hypothetical protein
VDRPGKRQPKALLRRRAWALSYAHQIRQGLSVREIAEARGLTREAVEWIMADACPAFLDPVMTPEVFHLVLQRERPRASFAKPAPVIALPAPKPRRPRWTVPDRALTHLVREIREDIRTKDRSTG